MKKLLKRRQGKVTRLKRGWSGMSHTRRLTVIIGVLFLCYFFILFLTQFITLWQLRGNVSEVESRMASVMEENEALIEEIDRLHQLDYIEKKARQDLGMIKPNEILFQVEEKDDKEKEN